MIALLEYWVTIFWGLGSLEFLFDILVLGPSVHTTYLGIILSLIIAIVIFYSTRKQVKKYFHNLFDEFYHSPLVFKFLCGFVLILFLIGGYEAAYPPHLLQEGDALNYHMAIPRQHLFLGSLAHIS